jgi:dihydrofolate reductase
MRRLILQMQVSVDGYVSAQRENVDWQVWNWGADWAWVDELKKDFNGVFESIDTLLLSRKMIEEGFLDHWSRTAKEHTDNPQYAFARKIGEAEKVVATGKLAESRWPRTTIASGDLVEEVSALKQRAGADIICFGGAGFASALVAYGLVDEYELFVNPTAVGAGLSIFGSAVDGLRLDPIGSKAYECGITVNRYSPAAA